MSKPKSKSGSLKQDSLKRFIEELPIVLPLTPDTRKLADRIIAFLSRGDKERNNPYLIMPIEQVIADARHGVSLARIAWRERDPDGAALVLGFVVEPKDTRIGDSIGHAKSGSPAACPNPIFSQDVAKGRQQNVKTKKKKTAKGKTLIGRIR